MAIGISTILSYMGTGFTLKDIIKTIRYFLTSEDSILNKVANAERLSAYQAIESIKSEESMHHLAVALGHLRVCYNVLNVIRQNQKTKWYHKIDDTSAKIKMIENKTLINEMIEMAILISKCHDILNEKENAKEWVDNAYTFFKEYENLSLSIARLPEIKTTQGRWDTRINYGTNETELNRVMSEINEYKIIFEKLISNDSDELRIANTQ